MTQNELNEVLSLHKQWLESDGAEGKDADLRDADLRDADLRDADLRDANLRYADLRDADLQCANMRGADMRRADMRGADMRRADLQCANMRGADMRRADLQYADLDYSVWPLWCGSFDVKCDVRLASQLAYHFCRLDCDDAEVIGAQNALIKLANKFHRVEECGVLKPKRIRKAKTNEV